MNGFVVRLKLDRGYGFIRPSSQGDDVFFHQSALNGLEFSDILLQRDVTFDVTDSGRRTTATNVRAAR